MSGTANVNDELFEGGPLLRLERSLGLVKPGRPLVAKRASLAVLIGWLPLFVLAAAQLLILSDESARSFFSDFAVHARFLVAVPALIFAEAECLPRLGKIVNTLQRRVWSSDQTQLVSRRLCLRPPAARFDYR